MKYCHISKQLASLTLIMISMAGLTGCQDSSPATWRTVSAAPVRPIPRNAARVDIQDSDIAHGMRAVFAQMAGSHGPVDPEPIIRDFVTPIRKGLYECGACQISNLRVNGAPVDLCVYFLAEPRAQLHIDLYLSQRSRADFRWRSQLELASR